MIVSFHMGEQPPVQTGKHSISFMDGIRSFTGMLPMPEIGAVFSSIFLYRRSPVLGLHMATVDPTIRYDNSGNEIRLIQLDSEEETTFVKKNTRFRVGLNVRGYVIKVPVVPAKNPEIIAGLITVLAAVTGRRK